MSIYSKQLFVGTIPASSAGTSVGPVPPNHTWVVRNILAWALGAPALYVVVDPAGATGELTLYSVTVHIDPAPNIDTRLTLEAGDKLVLKSSAGAIACCVSGYDLVA